MTEIIVTEHLFITLSDGARLAARLWLPKDAADKPVPAILEYIPYRKRDGTRGARRTHAWLVREARLCCDPRRRAWLGRVRRAHGG